MIAAGAGAGARLPSTTVTHVAPARVAAVGLRRKVYNVSRTDRLPITETQEDIMSFIDKAKNTAEKVAGEVKEAVGKATDDKDLQAEGKKDQASGSVKNAAEDVKDVFKK